MRAARACSSLDEWPAKRLSVPPTGERQRDGYGGRPELPLQYFRRPKPVALVTEQLFPLAQCSFNTPSDQGRNPRNQGVHEPDMPQTRLPSNPGNSLGTGSPKRHRQVLWLLGPLRRRSKSRGSTRKRRSRALWNGGSSRPGHGRIIASWSWFGQHRCQDWLGNACTKEESTKWVGRGQFLPGWATALTGKNSIPRVFISTIVQLWLNVLFLVNCRL